MRREHEVANDEPENDHSQANMSEITFHKRTEVQVIEIQK